MLCTHAEKLIPLFAGDDLPAREADALRRHLETCINCRRLAAEFEESRDWLRGCAAPQFDEATLDDMRDSVLREIGRIENRSRLVRWLVPGWNLRFAFAASLALLLFSALLNLAINWRQPSYDPESNQAEARKGGGNRVESTHGKGPDGRANSDKQTAINKTVRRRSGRKPVKPGPKESPPIETRSVQPDLIAENMETTETGVDQSAALDPADADPSPSRNMLRIEIQTADPSIRIIWFAPKSDTAPNTK
jgi:hypothetical protein